MQYKKDYFDSAKEYRSKSGLYKIKNKLFSDKLTNKHYELLLLNKWKFFKGSDKFLDVGCGKCEFLKLNPYNLKIQGMDIIPEAVEAAKKAGLKVKKGDVTKKLPYKNNEFDALNFSHVLEHLDDPTNAISEFKRILKPNGILAITVPIFSFKRFYDDYTHKKPYTKLSLYRLLRDNGFEDIKIENGPHLNKLVSILFFFFPKIRFSVEKLLGRIWPSELMAIARKK